MSNGFNNGKGINIVGVASVICTVIGSTWLISSKLNTAKSDIIRHSDEEDAKMTAIFQSAKRDLESRLTALEARPAKESWADGDMYRWSVKLQRENPTLRVPEPPMKADTQSR